MTPAMCPDSASTNLTEPRRPPAEQIVVDNETPDQVIGAKRVEGHRHVLAFEISAFAHAFLEHGELLLIDVHRQIAGIDKIDECDEIAGTPNTIFALGRQIREGGGEQRAAETVADRVNLALAGGRFHG